MTHDDLTTPDPDDLPVFTAHDVPDLFNALPMLFGFRPAESVVAVATRGPRHRVGFRLRMDLPPHDHVDDAAEIIVDHLRRQGAEGVIALALTDRQGTAHDLLDAIEARLGSIVPVVVARSDGSRYWVDVPGFPVEGVAYETSDHHVSIVQAVVAGQQVLPDREALVARFAPVAGERREQMLACTAEARARVLGLLDARGEDSPVMALRELVQMLQAAADGVPVTDQQAAQLSVWVSADHVRNAFWGTFTVDTAPVALTLMTRIAQVVVPPYEPAVLSLTAYAAWLTGDGAQALIAAERAHAADPRDTVAELMLGLVESGMSPRPWPVDDHLRHAG
jgi:hypothetical protein